FFPAVMIAAYYGGFWPGLLATLLGAVAANVVFTEPHYALGIKSINAAVALPLFVLVGAIISGLSESLHRARRRLVAEERRRAEEALREAEERFREQALRESEQRFRGTFDNAAVSTGHAGASGRWLRVNEKFCVIVGYPREELLKRT